MWDLIVSVPDHCLSFNFKKVLVSGAQISKGIETAFFKTVSQCDKS